MPPSDCPGCNVTSALTRAVGPGQKNKPGPGDCVLCSVCGQLYRFNDSLERIAIDGPPSDAPPEMKEALACAQAYLRGKRDGERFREPTQCPRCAFELDPKKAEGYDGRTPRPGDFAQCPFCRALLVYGNEAGVMAVDRELAEIETDARTRGIDAGELQRYERSALMTRLVVLRYMSDFPDDPPKFAMGPDRIAIMASISQVSDVICRDSGAAAIVTVLVGLSHQFNDCPEPTYLMLLGVLTAEGIPFERVSLGELGIPGHERPS